MTIVRPSTMDDVEYLATMLKDADVKEIWDSHNRKPYDALKYSLENSIMCWTIENEGVAVGMFGACAETVLSDRASVWMLTSDGINKIKMKFLRQGKDFLDLMLQSFPLLYNYTSCEHVESIGWLRFMGAKMGEPMKYGVEQKMFIPFVFERGASCV